MPRGHRRIPFAFVPNTCAVLSSCDAHHVGGIGQEVWMGAERCSISVAIYAEDSKEGEGAQRGVPSTPYGLRTAHSKRAQWQRFGPSFMWC